jgi:phage/plasmid-like protein (TIGR03299 family)
VQPRQVLDFFTELCQRYNLKMDTAGVIRGGVKFWAMARTGNQTDVGLRDIIKQYVVLASSADASMATTAKHTIKRIVCSNTFHANVGNFEPAIKVSHSTQFNAEAVKIDLGLMDREFDSIGELVKEMHNEKITDPDARRWFAELLSGKVKMDTDEVNAYATTARLFQTVFDSYKNGRGAENTIWGLFNGVTYTIDHVRGRTVDSQLDSALFGSGAQVKGKAWRKAVLLLGQI